MITKFAMPILTGNVAPETTKAVFKQYVDDCRHIFPSFIITEVEITPTKPVDLNMNIDGYIRAMDHWIPAAKEFADDKMADASFDLAVTIIENTAALFINEMSV